MVWGEIGLSTYNKGGAYCGPELRNEDNVPGLEYALDTTDLRCRGTRFFQDIMN